MNNPQSVLMYLRPVRLVYVRVTGAYEHTIPRAWKQLVSWYNDNGLAPPSGRGYGLARDNPADVGRQNCRYDACLTITPELEKRAFADLSIATLPGGAYACRRLPGGHGHLRSIVASVYAGFEPLPGLELDQIRPVVSVYADNEPGSVEADRRVDVCVPIIAVNDIQRCRVLA